MAITDFRGEYRWLSNFGDSPIEINNTMIVLEPFTAPTVEHAYQCVKTLNKDEREWVLSSRTPRIARNRGQKVSLRADWEMMKVMYMKAFVTAKFLQNPELAKKLLDTEDHHLIEGSDGWGDKFWGVAHGRGFNHLGRILMDVREERRRYHD